MIEAYSWRTSNGRKLHIALEELELEYRIHPIDIRKGEQRGLRVMADVPVTPMDDKAREIMYGAKQYERR